MSQTFDPREVSVIVDAEPLTGFSSGTPITIAQQADAVALKKGMKGAGAWILLTDDSALVTLVMLGSHPDNDILAALARSRKEFPIMVKDNSGRSLAFGRSARVQKMADKPYGSTEVQDVTWTILVASLDQFTAGN